MMVQLEFMDIRQYNIIPDSPRLSLTVLAFYLAKQSQLWQSVVKHLAIVTIPPKPLIVFLYKSKPEHISSKSFVGVCWGPIVD